MSVQIFRGVFAVALKVPICVLVPPLLVSDRMTLVLWSSCIQVMFFTKVVDADAVRIAKSVFAAFRVIWSVLYVSAMRVLLL